jgi:hypothetical protein
MIERPTTDKRQLPIPTPARMTGSFIYPMNIRLKISDNIRMSKQNVPGINYISRAENI